MLTSSMNSSDLLRILSADHERIIRWGQYRIKEMRSELLRGMKDKNKSPKNLTWDWWLK